MNKEEVKLVGQLILTGVVIVVGFHLVEKITGGEKKSNASGRGTWRKSRNKYQCLCERSLGNLYSQACDCNEGDKELGRGVVG